jgi:large subunit ribosomal protein L5
MQRLKSLYLKNVKDSLLKEFNYDNINKVPKLEKIIINRGFDETCQNSKILEVFSNELSIISGQKPIITKAKKAIAGFKVKENMPVGMCMTLRGEKMYSFLDRLINLSLPRIRDFQGLNPKSFDGRGNYNLGLNDQLMFPEIEFDKVIKIQGMDISIVTTAKTDREGLRLLQLLEMPFK